MFKLHVYKYENTFIRPPATWHVNVISLTNFIQFIFIGSDMKIKFYDGLYIQIFTQSNYTKYQRYFASQYFPLQLTVHFNISI